MCVYLTDALLLLLLLRVSLRLQRHRLVPVGGSLVLTCPQHLHLFFNPGHRTVSLGLGTLNECPFRVDEKLEAESGEEAILTEVLAYDIVI